METTLETLVEQYYKLSKLKQRHAVLPATPKEFQTVDEMQAFANYTHELSNIESDYRRQAIASENAMNTIRHEIRQRIVYNFIPVKVGIYTVTVSPYNYDFKVEITDGRE